MKISLTTKIVSCIVILLLSFVLFVFSCIGLVQSYFIETAVMYFFLSLGGMVGGIVGIVGNASALSELKKKGTAARGPQQSGFAQHPYAPPAERPAPPYGAPVQGQMPPRPMPPYGAPSQGQMPPRPMPPYGAPAQRPAPPYGAPAYPLQAPPYAPYGAPVQAPARPAQPYGAPAPSAPVPQAPASPAVPQAQPASVTKETSAPTEE